MTFGTPSGGATLIGVPLIGAPLVAAFVEGFVTRVIGDRPEPAVDAPPQG